MAALSLLLVLQVASSVCVFVADVFGTNGMAAEQAHDVRAAEWSFARAVAWCPFRYETLYRLGIARHSLGDYSGARDALERSVNYGPNNAYVLLALAKTDARTGDFPAARAALARTDALLPRYWRVAATAGEVEALAEDPVRAAEHLRKALDRPYVHRDEVLVLLASACVDAGDFAAALDHADEAATLRPDNLAYLPVRARALMGLGRPAEAVPLLEQYIDRMAEEPAQDAALAGVTDGLMFLARAHAEQGQWLPAADSLAKLFRAAGAGDARVKVAALELAARLPQTPTDIASAKACSTLGFTLAGVGESGTAAQLLEAALPYLAGPSRFACLYNLGTVLQRQGCFGESETRLREAVALDPSRLDAQIALAATLEAEGRPADARVLYQSLVENPGLDAQKRVLLNQRMATLAEK